MATEVGKACSGSGSSTQMSPPTSDKGSRNKRKFRAEPPVADASKTVSSQLTECSSYEFSADKFGINPNQTHSNDCDLCTACEDHSDTLKLDLGLSSAVGAHEAGPSTSCSSKEEIVQANEFHDAKWSDLTESQLEELVLCNLDTIFKSAIKKIVECGYDEDVATKAVLRSGLCYGFKDTVSNIVDNTLAFLKKGQEVVDMSREHYFEDLQQMEKYILAELVCVLHEVRPFFSTGDAMWCLLICDMNVSLACAMDTDTFNSNEHHTNVTSPVFSQPESKLEPKISEIVANPSKPNQSDTHDSQPEAPTIALASNAKPKSAFTLKGLVNEKEGQISPSDTTDKSFSVSGTSQSHDPEEKFIGSRKLSGITKREYILRQKSIRLEKSFRTYGSRGASRSGKLSAFGGLMLDKKLKSVSDSGLNVKNTSLKITKAMGNNIGLTSSTTLGLENVKNAISTSPRNNVNTQPALSAAETELSLSIPAKSVAAPMPVSCHPEPPSFSQSVPQDKKDEMIMKLVPRVKELQSQLQEWTEWANQKVMQAARRLGKDKAELKTLKQESEEVERLKREKQTLEESTMKKLCEMENALCKASGQVERANASVRRLEVENVALRQQMEGAKLRAAESAASCQEVAKREKTTQMKSQTWEKQKGFLQEELTAEKRKLGQLRKEVEQAKDLRDQVEARWKQEEEAKEALFTQANTLKKEREKLEVSTKSKEEGIRLKAEKNLQRYKDDIQKLEKEISQLRLKTDSSKIAALKRGATECKVGPSPNESHILYISQMVKDFKEYSASGGVKRERECVMCLSEEMSIVFLPCAHQVVCSTCNELHEKQGMKECPSCRGPIQRRISVRYASS